MKSRSVLFAGLGLSALLLAGCMSPAESDGLALINNDRAVNGAAPLGENLALISKAQRWAAELARTSGGQCSLQTLRHSDLRADMPAGWRASGENVGCRVAPGDVAAQVAPLEAAFMNSPGHRENILNRSYNYGGVGLATAPAAAGNGMYVVYEAQEFMQW